MNAYDQFQMEHYGNILPDAENTPDSDLHDGGIEELNRLADWIEMMAERQLVDQQ